MFRSKKQRREQSTPNLKLKSYQKSTHYVKLLQEISDLEITLNQVLSSPDLSGGQDMYKSKERREFYLKD
jgi:hypothetical protein